MSVLKLLFVFLYYTFIFNGPATCAVKIQEGNHSFSGLFSPARFIRMHMTLMKAGKQPAPLYEKFSNNFCQDVFFLTMAMFILKPDKNCLLKKGNYTITGINVKNLIHMITGEYFIHESIQFNLEFFTKMGSIFCYQTIIESKQLRRRKIAPKTRSTPKSAQIIQS